MRISERFDSWIFSGYDSSADGSGLYRMFYALTVLMYFLPRGLWIGGFPSDWYTPAFGPALFFSGFPSHQILAALNLLGIVGAILLFFGVYSTFASLGLFVSLLSLNVFIHSLGKINHDILIVLIPLLLAGSTWNASWSGLGSAGVNCRSSWRFSLLALIVGWVMFSAAAPKVATSWLDPSTQAVRYHLVRNIFTTGRENELALETLKIKSELFWEFLDWSTIIVEAAFALACFNAKAMRIVCAIACFFHAGVYFSMNISFAHNLVAYAAFINWRSINQRQFVCELRRLFERVMASRGMRPIVVVGALITSVVIVSQASVSTTNGLVPLYGTLHVLSVLVAASYLGHVALGLRKRDFA